MLHRDIKPENFCIGLGADSNTIYIIDFGLAKRFKNPKTGEHIPFRDKKSLTGTARYASLNTHLGFEQSRRDDLESIGYVLLYFMRGNLPWQGMLGPDSKNKYGKITEKKTNITPEILCEGFPKEFVNYFYYVKSLKFDEKPDYSFLRKLLKEAFYAMKFDTEVFFDWISLQSQLKQSKNDSHRDLPTEIKLTTEESSCLINIPKESKIQLKADIDKKKFKSSQDIVQMETIKTKCSNLELDEIPSEKDKANVPNTTCCKKPKKIGSNRWDHL